MTNNKLFIRNKTALNNIIFTLIILLSITQTHAAEFCINTASALSAALVTAANNNEDDTIKVEQGTYVTSSAVGNMIQFNYLSTKTFSLNLEGGYTNLCASRKLNPSNTILDGNNENRVLNIMQSDGDGTIVLEGFTIQNGNNSDFFQGGGLLIRGITNFTGEILVSNNIFRFNQSTATSSGALSIENEGNCALINNLIHDNTALSRAGTVDCNGSIIIFSQNTVTRNMSSLSDRAALHAQGSTAALVVNNIFWGNAIRDLDVSNATTNQLLGNNIDSQEGVSGAGSANNISVDPKFISMTNFRLAADSPSIRTGDTSSSIWNTLLPSVDLDGNQRITEGEIDMGAYQRDLSDLCVVVPVNPTGVVQFCL